MVLPAWIARTARVIVQDAQSRWLLADLDRRVDEFARVLAVARAPVGLLADNSPHWIALDLAAQLAGAALVPLPRFFTATQLAHVVDATGMQTLLCDDATLASGLGFSAETGVGESPLRLFNRARGSAARLASRAIEPIRKITFTSGTTGTPKGVCLTADVQIGTARALATALGALGIERHLSLLPFAMLLENIAGIYAPLQLGATCVCPALAEVGLTGACRFDADRCLAAIERYRPESTILLPQMLAALVERLSVSSAAARRTRSLKFVAVGGAKTSPSLIARARALGLPVYEGYGLTECASVVALNSPGADRIGTVGRALPKTAVRVAADGEIEVAGRNFCGYLGAPQASDTWIKTGDLGAIDSAGFISISGRKKSVLVTSFGRNIAPEWPEGLLNEQPAIAQAIVFGDERPFLVALLVASNAAISDATLAAAVDAANRDLPDYARIGAWLRADEAFSAANGLATANGRLCREAVFARYACALSEQYAMARPA